MKFFNLKSMIGMFLILFMAACQDDTGSGAKVEEGLAAKLNLSIQVPAVEEVNTRAIADNESQINELALFMYSENGSSVNYIVNLTGYLQDNGTTGNGNRTYSLTGDVLVKTGTFTVYAVANWSSPFANSNALGSYVASGDIPSQDELKAMLAQNSSVLALGSGYLPMTCVVPNVTFSVAEEDGTNSLSLSLKRATARIEFTVQNGEALNAVQGEFIPSTFQVFNLPSSSYLFDQGDNMVSTDDYFNSAEMAVNEDGSFEFLMNENVRPAGKNIKEYQDREIYEGNWTNPTSFKNAPKGSTYVVINGYYRDNSQSGPVSYRIHLGNFSSSNTNFTVNRNERHLYKVTVNGIENISTDVEVKNPGAYGDIEVRALQFTSEPTIQDAHYVIYPIDIKAENVSDGKLTSNVSWLTLRTNLTDLEKEGYWIEEDRGTQSIDIPDGTTRVYAFLEENIGNDTREATLSLYQEAYSDFKDEFVVQQYPVSWNGDIGCERIEGETYPWGFLWDDNMTITYDMTNMNWLGSILANIYLNWFSSYDYINTSGLLLLRSVTINFNEISAVNVALHDADGHANTKELYNYNGISEASSLMEQLERWGGVPDRELPLNPTEFAARACAMKNKYSKRTQTTDQGETAELPYLKDENFVWYLPSRQEAPQMKDNIIPLSGDYWTSTAAGDNQTAYKYTAGNSSADQTARRDVNLNVRAVRKR